MLIDNFSINKTTFKHRFLSISIGFINGVNNIFNYNAIF